MDSYTDRKTGGAGGKAGKIIDKQAGRKSFRSAGSRQVN